MKTEKQLREEMVLGDMKRWRDTELIKDRTTEILTEVMREKFPNIEGVRFTEYSIHIETKKHHITLYSWSNLSEVEPIFACTEPPTMPDSIEKFKILKDYIDEDYRQCYTAFFWLFNRYNFGYRYK